jgi:hypothetical protein
LAKLCPRPVPTSPTKRAAAATSAQISYTEAMIRIGVDFGGTKIEAAALDVDGRVQARVRSPSPGSYSASLEAVRDLIADTERQAGISNASIGIGIPGSPSPASGLIRNANTTHLNDNPCRPIWSACWDVRCGWPTTPTVLPCRKPPTGPARTRTWFLA